MHFDFKNGPPDMTPEPISFHASHLDDQMNTGKPKTICTPCESCSGHYGIYNQRYAKLKWISHCIQMIA
jgi:hypothetical protein